MVSEDSTCTAAREASSAAASHSSEQRAAACGVRHNVQTDIQWSGNKMMILCQSEHQKIPMHPKHPRLKKKIFSSRNPLYLLAASINTRRCDISGMLSMHPTERPRTSPPGSTGGHNTCLCIPHAYVCRSPLSREQMQLALSKLEKKLLRLQSWGRRSDWLLGGAVQSTLRTNC